MWMLLNDLKDNCIILYDAKQKDGYKEAILAATKKYYNSVGTLAYRNPSLYELDEKEKML